MKKTENKKVIIIIAAIIAAVALIAAGIGIGIGIINAKNNAYDDKVVAETIAFTEDYNILKKYAQHPERNFDNLMNVYEMSEEKANEFYECPENWLVYNLSLSIENNTDESITVYGFKIKNNGKNGLYLSNSVGGELAVGPDASGPAVITVFCENGDVSTDEAQALTESFDIEVLYTKTPEEFDDGTQSVEETKSTPLIITQEEEN